MMHEIEAEPQSGDLTVENGTTCAECGRVMATTSTLTRHMSRMHASDRATLPIPAQRDEIRSPKPTAVERPAFWPTAPAPSYVLPEVSPQVPKKPMWKKKRFLIPVSLLSLFVLIGVVSPSPKEDRPTAGGSVVQSAPQQAPELTAAQKAEAARVASAKAAADRAAAAKAAAAKAAAAKAAAQAAAAKAAADRAAAAKAAAEKAARERPVAITPRAFALLVKNPDNYVGRHYVIYGEVTQFDAATGSEAFLADSGATKDSIEYGFTEYSDNTLYVGDASALGDVVEGDVFRATVEVLGSESYDTQIGGNTTVPKFQIQSIAVYGSTK